MNFSQLKYFSEVVRTKSLNKAAKNSYITYPAMCKAMNSLEAELKTSLLIRERNGVILTANGKKFYDDVLKILEIQKSWSNFSEENNFSINICASTSPCTVILNKVLPKFALQFPDINLTYTPVLSYEIPDYLLDTSKICHIAITCVFPDHPDIRVFAQKHGMICEYLYSSSHYAALNSKLVEKGQTSITAEQLKNLPCILSTSDYYDHLSIFSIFKENKKVYRCFGLDSQLQMTLSYNAVSLISEHYIHDAKKNFGDKIKILPIHNFQSIIDYYIVYPSNCTANELLVINYIKKFAQKNLK